MTDAQLDAIKEAEDARIWEELNADDPKAKTAVEFLRQAAMTFVEAESYLQSAADAVEDSPETYRIASIKEATEDLEIAVRVQIERMMK